MAILGGNFKSATLQLLLQKAAVNSGMLIENWSIGNHYAKFVDLTVNIGGKTILIVANLRNITSAQLPNDPEMMRRQIESLDTTCLPANTFRQVSLLVGFCEVDGEVIIGVWNPFDYGSHITNRSCYIRPEQLLAAKSNGLASMKYKNISPVYACNLNNFGNLISKFMGDNSTY